MPKHFTFIGDPGPDARAMLEALRSVDLAAKRADMADDLLDRLAHDVPSAILFNAQISNLGKTIEAIRENRHLASVPILVHVKQPDPEYLSDAFRWGVDDFFVEGAVNQFSALVSAIEKQDTWKTVRAPAGQVILAHEERLERAKFGRILRRNGFDTFFAGTSEEFEKAVRIQNVRAAIISCDLPGVPVLDIVSQIAGELPNVPPIVFVAKTERIEAIRDAIPPGISGKLFEAGSDAEGITFVLNELLAPPPTGARRSPRVLYGTPISFVHKGGVEPMNGFTFNINYGGIYIRTLASLPLQTEIEVRFRPPFGRGHVFADAQVVWRKQLGDTAGAASPPGMGVQFLHLWQADLAAYETGYNLLLEKNESTTSIPATTTKPPEAKR